MRVSGIWGDISGAGRIGAIAGAGLVGASVAGDCLSCFWSVVEASTAVAVVDDCTARLWRGLWRCRTAKARVKLVCDE